MSLRLEAEADANVVREDSGVSVGCMTTRIAACNPLRSFRTVPIVVERILYSECGPILSTDDEVLGGHRN